MKINKLVLILSHFVLIRIFVVCALVVFSTVINASNSWNDFHWARTNNPFVLLVVNSVTPNWQPALNSSLSLWSMSNVLDLNITSYNDRRNIRKRCPMVQGQMRVCNAAYGYTGWIGLATIAIDSNAHIVKGTAKMNDSYASYWTTEKMNHVICQEIGHVLGLDHVSTDGSSQQTCMDYSQDPNSQWPNTHDYEQLLASYNDIDTYDSYENGTDSGSDDSGGKCNAPKGKGCNKGQNAGVPPAPPMGKRVIQGRNFEIWVAPRANNGLWIHHVYLIPQGSHD